MNTSKKLKILTILGTRPEIIRLSRILPTIDNYFNHKIVFTRQNFDFELSGIFFEELKLRKPDYTLDVQADSLGGQIAHIILQTEKVLLKEKPDALVVLGDTNSSLSAIVAKRLHIPIFHLEAGNRSFDNRVPEEVNRKIVDHISDYNLCYTQHARRYLLKEGIAGQTIFVIGSPLREVFSFFSSQINSSSSLKKHKLTEQKYFIVSLHREENVDNADILQELLNTLNEVAKDYNLPVLVSLHPRTKKRIKHISLKMHPNVQLFKPFGYFSYNQLQKNALCVLSDSGSIQEESAILNFPAVQLRKSTERPEAFDEGSIIVCGFKASAVLSAINIAISYFKKRKLISSPKDYLDDHVSEKVVKLLIGLVSIKKFHDRIL